jgi:hypothetical protein
VPVDPWVRLSPRTREAVEAEAGVLPLPGVDQGVEVAWST